MTLGRNSFSKADAERITVMVNAALLALARELNCQSQLDDIEDQANQAVNDMASVLLRAVKLRTQST